MTFASHKKPGPPCIHDPAGTGPEPCMLCVHHLGKNALCEALPLLKAMLENPATVAALAGQGVKVNTEELRRLEWECVYMQAEALGFMTRKKCPYCAGSFALYPLFAAEQSRDREAIRQRLLSIAIIALCAFSMGLAVAFAVCTATGR